MTFQDYYCREYMPRHPEGICRLLHLLGLLVSLALLAIIVWVRVWWLLVAVPVPSYLVSWLGHVAVHNVPTVLEYPIWSFFGYWKMIVAMIRGRSLRAATSDCRND